MTHTPGPWGIGQSAHTYEEALVSANGAAVAYAAWDGGSNCHLAIKNPADKSLITAAPDLLKALESLRKRAWFIIGVNDPFIAEADAAIAKARTAPE